MRRLFLFTPDGVDGGGLTDDLGNDVDPKLLTTIRLAPDQPGLEADEDDEPVTAPARTPRSTATNDKDDEPEDGESEERTSSVYEADMPDVDMGQILAKNKTLNERAGILRDNVARFVVQPGDEELPVEVHEAPRAERKTTSAVDPAYQDFTSDRTIEQLIDLYSLDIPEEIANLPEVRGHQLVRVPPKKGDPLAGFIYDATDEDFMIQRPNGTIKWLDREAAEDVVEGLKSRGLRTIQNEQETAKLRESQVNTMTERLVAVNNVIIQEGERLIDLHIPILNTPELKQDALICGHAFLSALLSREEIAPSDLARGNPEAYEKLPALEVEAAERLRRFVVNLTRTISQSNGKAEKTLPVAHNAPSALPAVEDPGLMTDRERRSRELADAQHFYSMRRSKAAER